MRPLTTLAAGVLCAALASSAFAWTGVATGNVNLRTADTVHAPRVTTIPRGAAVEVHSCPSWCYLTFRGITGWASPSYIAAADYRPAPRVYYRRPAPAPFYYVGPSPYFYGIPHRRHGYPWRHRRHRHSGFSLHFGF